MATITELAPQKRTKERVNVFLDGSYAFSVNRLAAATLHIGQSLTPEEIDEMQFVDAVERAKQSAYRYLSYRPRSTNEMSQYLQKKGFDQGVVEKTSMRLVELDLLDDRAFARYWVEQRERFSPRSRFALRSELYAKGVERHVVEEAVAEINEEAAARRAVRKKAKRWSRLPQDDFMTKVSGYLQRRGFSYDIIATVSHDMWEDVVEGDNSAHKHD